MKQDILSRLYYGEIVPWENRNDKSPEMVSISEQVNKDIEYLEKLLDEDNKMVLERILNNRSELESQMIFEGFKDGFRLGVQLLTAGLDGGNKL